MRRDFRGREHEPGIDREIVQGDVADIHECDVLLVSYSKPSVGTAMEVFLAHRMLGKTVVVVHSGEGHLSPWLTYHSDRIFASYAEACEFIDGLE